MKSLFFLTVCLLAVTQSHAKLIAEDPNDIKCAIYQGAICSTQHGYRAKASWPYSCRDERGNFKAYCTETRKGAKFIFNLGTLDNAVYLNSKQIRTLEGSDRFFTGCETANNPMTSGKTQFVTADFVIVDASNCNSETEHYNY